MTEEKKQLRVEDLEVGDKVLIILGADREFFTYSKGIKPGLRMDRKKLLAGSYVFEYIKSPSEGAVDNWFATEYPEGNGIMFGISARFLCNLANQAGSNVTIKKPTTEEEPPESLSMEH